MSKRILYGIYLIIILAFFLAPAKPSFFIITEKWWNSETSEFLTYVNGTIKSENYEEEYPSYCIEANANLIKIIAMKKYEGKEGILTILYPWALIYRDPLLHGDSDYYPQLEK